jgi:predicted transcriptional regulator
MSIKTIHNVEPEIDGVAYKVEVLDPTSNFKSIVAEDSKKLEDIHEKYSTIKSEYDYLVECFELNNRILKSEHNSNYDILLDQKNISKDKYKKQKELKEVNRELDLVNDKIEKLYKKRFDILVQGEDKKELERACISKGINFSKLFEYIATLVAKSIEKK